MIKYLIPILVLFSQLLSAQKAFDPFDFEGMNAAFLEELILEKINQHRKEKELSLLKTNTILAKAAQDQSDFQAEIKRLTHFQKQKEKANPARRIFYYEGAFSAAGENCAFVPIRSNSTYESIAENFFQSWMHSPPHYKNIITPDYHTSGIRFQIDTIEGHLRLFGTHVFAGVEAMKLKEIDVPKDVYGILPLKEAFCSKELKGGEFLSEKLANYSFFDGDTLFLGVHDINYFKKLIKFPKDGIAVDLIDRKQYPCEGPNKINAIAPYKGAMLEPVYRDELFRNNRSNLGGIITPIAIIPKALQGKYQFNFITIKKNCACRNSMNVSAAHNSLPLLDLYPVWHTLDSVNIFPQKTKEDLIRLEFAQESTVLGMKEWQKLNRLIQKEGRKIQRVHIFATSSVEGSTDYNLKLQEKRAAYIRKELMKKGIDLRRITYHTLERWDLFFQQIASTPYRYLKDWKREDIKKALKSNVKMKRDLASILAEERQTIISFKISEEEGNVLKSNPDSLLMAMENHLAQEHFDTALILQTELIKLFVNDEIEAEHLLQTEFPIKKEYLALLSNQLAVELFFGPFIPHSVFIPNYRDPFYEMEQVFVDKLIAVKTLDSTYFPMLFNFNAFSIKFMRFTNESILPPDTLLQQIEGLGDSLRFGKFARANQTTIEKLKYNYHLAGVDYFYRNYKYSKRRRALSYIYNFYDKQDLHQGDIVTLAGYFNENFMFQWALNLLEPFMDDPDKLDDALFMYLQTTLLFYGVDKNEFKLDAKLWEEALKRNPKRLCNWLNNHFQTFHDPGFKKFYCEKCR